MQRSSASWFTLGITIVILCSSAPRTTLATQSTYSETEMSQFSAIRNQFVFSGKNPDELALVAKDIRSLLDKYPETINKKSLTTMLFSAEAGSGATCDVLEDLASEIITTAPLHQDFYEIAKSTSERGCDLDIAGDAIANAIQRFEGGTPVRVVWYHTLAGDIHLRKDEPLEALSSYEFAYEATNSMIEAQMSTKTIHQLAGTLDSRIDLKVKTGRMLAKLRTASGETESAFELYEELIQIRPNDQVLTQEFEGALILNGLNESQAQKRSSDLIESITSNVEREIDSKKLDLDIRPFTLPDFNGRTVSLSDFEGTVTLISFWAGWCAPCFAEIPFLLDLADRYSDQPVSIVFINVDEDFAITLNIPSASEAEGEVTVEVMPIPSDKSDEVINRTYMMKYVAEQYGIDLPMLIGDRQVKTDYSVVALPLTVLLDKRGRAQYRHLGFSEQSMIQTQLELEIQALLSPQ